MQVLTNSLIVKSDKIHTIMNPQCQNMERTIPQGCKAWLQVPPTHPELSCTYQSHQTCWQQRHETCPACNHLSAPELSVLPITNNIKVEIETVGMNSKIQNSEIKLLCMSPCSISKTCSSRWRITFKDTEPVVQGELPIYIYSPKVLPSAKCWTLSICDELGCTWGVLYSMKA